MAPKIAIRLARIPEDAPELTSLLHQAYANLGAQGLNYTAVDQSVETTISRCEGGRCWAAESENRLVGTIKLNEPDPEDDLFAYRDPEVGIINQFGVLPTFQGCGIGKALHDQAEIEAKRWGKSALVLDTADSARDLIAYYERLGYTVNGSVQWPGKTYRSVLMRKSL